MGEEVDIGSGVPGWAHYQKASQPGVSCGTCDFFVADRCEMFDYASVRADYTCDRWEGILEKAEPDVDTLAPMYTGLPPSLESPEESVPQSLRDLLMALEPAQFHGSKTGASQLSKLTKRQSNPAIMALRVHGVIRTPDGQLSYRMVTKDGHYVGRTNATNVRAKKGDILKVQANDFSQTDNGDFHWDNPNVVSHYSDAPHNRKDVEALAGGSLVKENPAPGPAGDIPPAEDMGASSSMPSGPTLEAVHINVPLLNISTSYGPKKLKYKVQKANKHKQLIYGVVLEPDVLDSQDDYMLSTQVERAAHNYLKKGLRGKATVSRLQHKTRGFFKNKPSVVPVESFIAPVDFTYDGQEMVKKGTWVMVLHVEDPDIWDDVMSGQYTGLSIGGTGIRQDMPHDEGSINTFQDPFSWFNQTSDRN